MIIKVENLANKKYFPNQIISTKLMNDLSVENILNEVQVVNEAILNDSNDCADFNLYIKKVTKMTKEEKKRLYLKAINELSKCSFINKDVYFKDFDKLNNDDFYLFQQDLIANNKLNSKEKLYIEKAKLLNKYKKYSDFEYVFTLDKDHITPLRLLYFKKYAQELIKENKKLVLVISKNMLDESNSDRVNYVYSKQEIDLLEEIDNYLKVNNSRGVIFNEAIAINSEKDVIEDYTLKDIKKVNNLIDNLTNKIIESNYSPLETMVYLHKYFTSHYYYNPCSFGNAFKGRVLPDVINNSYIVCSGYASFFKAIIDRLDNKNLKSKLMAVSFYDKKDLTLSIDAHCQLLIAIKDSKYGINKFNYYIEDPTYDSILLKNKGKDLDGGFAHCLLPIESLKYMKKEIYNCYAGKGNRFSNLIGDNTKGFVKHVNKDYVCDFIKEFSKKSAPIKKEMFAMAIGIVFNRQIEKRKISVNSEFDKTKKRILKVYTPACKSVYKSDDNRFIYPLLAALVR